MMQSTDAREAEMARLARVAELFAQLMGSDPSPEELAIRERYPSMPRERVVRLVAVEFEKGHTRHEAFRS